MGRTRRRAAVQARVVAAGYRALARRRVDDVRRMPGRRIPEDYWPAPHPALVVFDGYEYQVFDGAGQMVLYERAPDYVVPWAEYAVVAFFRPRPLPPAVRRRAVRWCGSARRRGRLPLWPV